MNENIPKKIIGEYFAIKGLISMQYMLGLKDEKEVENIMEFLKIIFEDKEVENIMEFLKIIFEDYDEKFKEDDYVEYDPYTITIIKVEKNSNKSKKGQTMKKQG